MADKNDKDLDKRIIFEKKHFHNYTYFLMAYISNEITERFEIEHQKPI